MSTRRSHDANRITGTHRLMGFQRRYEQTTVPFDWRFTKADLDALLRRLSEREQPPTAA
jgi:hypothetical protein